jgi:hypothetical protein
MSGTLLDLGSQPLVNNLCNSANEALEAERFPLRAVYEDDLTIHLDTEVPPRSCTRIIYTGAALIVPTLNIAKSFTKAFLISTWEQ